MDRALRWTAGVCFGLLVLIWCAAVLGMAGAPWAEVW